MGVILIWVAGAILWLSTPYMAGGLATAALNTTPNVTVENGSDSIVFRPRTTAKNVGMIIYPGGRVDPESYSPLARELAAAGHLTVIVRMPLNLAVLNALAGNDVVNTYSNIDSWIVIGHSLGGSMAARLAESNPEVEGLVLLAAYPETGLDLSDSEIEVLTILGSEDGLVSESQITESLQQLPEDTEIHIIVGGNHAQFGDYGVQDGDGEPTVSFTEQLFSTLVEILELAEVLAIE